jgi:hypothetical protein
MRCQPGKHEFGVMHRYHPTLRSKSWSAESTDMDDTHSMAARDSVGDPLTHRQRDMLRNTSFASTSAARHSGNPAAALQQLRMCVQTCADISNKDIVLKERQTLVPNSPSDVSRATTSTHRLIVMNSI